MAFPASAGMRTDPFYGEVEIAGVSFSGIPSHVRASGDKYQFITCLTETRVFPSATVTPYFSQCAARDLKQNYKACTSTSSEFAAAVRGIASDDYITVFLDQYKGECSALRIVKSSTHMPKQP